MKLLEHWVLRVADSDWTWFGLKWLRPAKLGHLGLGHILLSSVLLGLPGVAVGGGLIYLALAGVQPGVWVWLFALVMIVELPLNILVAHFWNRRSEALANGSLDRPTSQIQ